MRELEPFAEGQVLMVTAGDYSDYHVVAHMVCLKGFHPRGVVESYLSEHPEQGEDYAFKTQQFLAWLSAEGYVTDVPARPTEWHIESYGLGDGYMSVEPEGEPRK